jgi:hypothetical protein
LLLFLIQFLLTKLQLRTLCVNLCRIYTNCAPTTTLTPLISDVSDKYADKTHTCQYTKTVLVRTQDRVKTSDCNRRDCDTVHTCTWT